MIERPLTLEKVSVGNYVKDKRGGIKALTIDDLKRLERFEPVEITHERLLQLGFQHAKGEDETWEAVRMSYIEGDEVWWINGLYYLTKDVDQFKMYYSSDEDNAWQIAWVNYIHEIQQIYNAVELNHSAMKFQVKPVGDFNDLPEAVRDQLSCLEKTVDTTDKLKYHIRHNGKQHPERKEVYELVIEGFPMYTMIKEIKEVEGNYVEVLADVLIQP